MSNNPKAYSEPCLTSRMEGFAKIWQNHDNIEPLQNKQIQCFPKNSTGQYFKLFIKTFIFS